KDRVRKCNAARLCHGVGEQSVGFIRSFVGGQSEQQHRYEGVYPDRESRSDLFREHLLSRPRALRARRPRPLRAGDIMETCVHKLATQQSFFSIARLSIV